MAVEEPGRRVDAGAALGLLARELQPDAGALALGDVADHGVVGHRIGARVRACTRPDPALDAVEPAQAVGRVGRLARAPAARGRRRPAVRSSGCTHSYQTVGPSAPVRQRAAEHPLDPGPTVHPDAAPVVRSRPRRRTRRRRRAPARAAGRGRCARSSPRAAPSRRRRRRRGRRRRRRAGGAGRSAPRPSARRRRSRTGGTRARAGAAGARWRSRRAPRSARRSSGWIAASHCSSLRDARRRSRPSSDREGVSETVVTKRSSGYVSPLYTCRPSVSTTACSRRSAALSASPRPGDGSTAVLSAGKALY